MLRSRMFLRRLLFLTTIACVALPVASAQGFTVTITIDEGGHGVLTNSLGVNAPLPASQVADPGPGGKSSVLFYDMLNPLGLVAGDLIITEGSATGDVLRFSPTTSHGGVFVYSADVFTAALADVGLPTAQNANTVTVAEPSNGVVTYTPTAGQPGFVALAAGPVTYVFTSPPHSLSVPAASTWSMTALGAILIAAAGLTFRKAYC